MRATSSKAAGVTKTRVVTAVVILSNVLGDSILRAGLQQVGSLVAKPPLAYILALFNPLVAVGVSMLILWMLSHMALVSWADLSYVLPVTSIGYALVALAGRVFSARTSFHGALGRDFPDCRGCGAGWTNRIQYEVRGSAGMKWFLVAIIVVCTTVGEVMQAKGMRAHGEIDDFRPGALGRVMNSIARNGMVMGSVLAMAISFFAFMTLLSVEDVSFAVPATAASYVLETAMAKLILKERISGRRWVGASLVACGVALLNQS